MEDDYIFKIILCGDTNVGKSTFFNKLRNETYFNKNITPTVGVDFAVFRNLYNNCNIKIHLWDTAGQERFRSVITSYFKNISATIIMFSLDDIDSLKNVPYWIKISREYCTCNHNHPIILLGNKGDKVKYISENNKELIINYIEEYNIYRYEEISGLYDILHPNNFFKDLIVEIFKNIDNDCCGILNKNKVKPIVITEKNEKKKFSCCKF